MRGLCPAILSRSHPQVDPFQKKVIKFSVPQLLIVFFRKKLPNHPFSEDFQDQLSKLSRFFPCFSPNFLKISRSQSSQETYDQRHHLCRLRKATLHFSLLGLRDVAPLPRVEALGSAGGTVHAEKPSVTVEVVQFVAPEEQKDAGKAAIYLNLVGGCWNMLELWKDPPLLIGKPW